MQYREAILDAWESNSRKAYEYLSVFAFLVVNYSIFISIYLKVVHTGDGQVSSFLPALVKFCIFSALPLAVLAYADKDWTSHDVAPVCLAAWVAACIALSFKCKLCALGLAFPFFPFILSASLAHGVGSLCRFLKPRAS